MSSRHLHHYCGWKLPEPRELRTAAWPTSSVSSVSCTPSLFSSSQQIYFGSLSHNPPGRGCYLQLRCYLIPRNTLLFTPLSGLNCGFNMDSLSSSDLLSTTTWSPNYQPSLPSPLGPGQGRHSPIAATHPRSCAAPSAWA